MRIGNDIINASFPYAGTPNRSVISHKLTPLYPVGFEFTHIS